MKSNIAVAAPALGAVIAGVWALWNYTRNRTHVPRLQIELDGQIVERGEECFLVATLKAKNVGQSIVRLPEPEAAGAGPRGCSIFVAPLGVGAVGAETGRFDWEDMRYRDEFEGDEVYVFDVFFHYASIEPGLSLIEQKLVRLPHASFEALWLRLRVLAHGQSWSAVAIVVNRKEKSDTGGSS